MYMTHLNSLYIPFLSSPSCLPTSLGPILVYTNICFFEASQNSGEKLGLDLSYLVV